MPAMRTLLTTVLMVFVLQGQAHAVADAKANARTKPAAAAIPAVVTAAGAGQAGYVHYWLITAPDGAEEIQVGIELADQRIAWSFPGLGVHLSSFVAAGEVDAGGRMFRIRHLYGLRPFAQEAAMRRLRTNLTRRVMPLAQRRVPYCELNGMTPELCMSCMSFVSQVLFPGKTAVYPDFPRNFPRIDGEPYHTTEDLLLYLTGLHALRSESARRQRIAALGGPQELQEELGRLAARLPGNGLALADAGNREQLGRKVKARPKPAVRRTPGTG